MPLRRPLSRLCVGALLLTAVVACSSGSPKATSPKATSSDAGGAGTVVRAPTTTIRSYLSTVAEAVPASVGVYERPGQPQPAQVLANPQDSGAPLVFLVKEQQPDWLAVYVPVRPNGSTGWVRRADIRLFTHEYRIVVELDAREIIVWQRDAVLLRETVGIGSDATPTPGGVYYTRGLLQPRDDTGEPYPDGPYGPYAYVLSGFSEVLYDFAGGNGELGIHGTNDARGLGQNGGHGCIRMSNEGISRLAATLPLGVPVEIRP